MKFPNWLVVILARKRWTKRLFMNFFPKISHKKILNKLNFHYDPRDLQGPSFHFGYDLEKGFNNYETQGKNLLMSYLPKDGVFYDIGANIGMFSAYFMLNRPDTHLYAFEPVDLSFKCLSNSLLNFSDNVHLYKNAIGLENENKKIYKCDLNDGGHSFYNGSDTRQSEDVVVVNLDSFRVNNSIPLPDVVKIDVEGFELEVLKGISNIILESKPVMLIESNNKDLSEKGEFWNYFKNLENIGVSIIDPLNSQTYNMNELSEVAKLKLHNEERELSDYLYYFK